MNRGRQGVVVGRGVFDCVAAPEVSTDGLRLPLGDGELVALGVGLAEARGAR